MEYYCEKDNRQTDISKGCRHPKDFCQHRQACMIHFLEQEERRNRKVDGKGVPEVSAENGSDGQRM
jgi:hypothetical protein